MDPPSRVLSLDLVRGWDVWLMLFVNEIELLPPVVGVNPYAALGRSLGMGTIRSILFAWAVVHLSGWMGARGLRLHL